MPDHVYTVRILVCILLSSAIAMPAAAGFTEQGDIVFDDQQGVYWQRRPPDRNSDGHIDRHDRWTWQEAGAYCQSLDLGGHEDWRLPSYEELETLVDYTTHSPAIDAAFASNNGLYWTLSELAEDQDKIWAVSFQFGDDYVVHKDSRNFVRCIRP